VELTFWGVRGSIPVPGPQTRRWGGNSSCLELRAEGLPPLVLDCGTGARGLGEKLAREQADHIQVLFSHLHTDHLFGFPFFAPVFRPGCRIEVGVPSWSAEEAREKLARYLNGTFHPLRLRELIAQIEFSPVRPDRTQVFDEGWQVATLRLLHPGGSIGYRVTHEGHAIAYPPDTGPFSSPVEGLVAGEPAGPAEQRLVRFLQDADLVVFDTMLEADTCLDRLHWGHAFPEYAIEVCKAAGVDRVVLFHHDPAADDDALDARIARYAEETEIEVLQAREGETLVVSD